MANALGMMILNQSEDLVCDFDQLIESLNMYEWNNQGVGWVKVQHMDEEISILLKCDGYDRVQYPSVFPDELKGVIGMGDDGVECFIQDPTEEEFESHIDLVFDTAPLEVIAKDLSKHISQGQIEIASTCNEKHRYVQMDQLIVKSDGSAYRKRLVTGKGCDEMFSEKFVMEGENE